MPVNCHSCESRNPVITSHYGFPLSDQVEDRFRGNDTWLTPILFDFRKPGSQGQSKIPPSGVRDDRLCLRSTLFFGFSPPLCKMTILYCSLYKILTISYRPDSYKVRSGPGVSGFRCQKNVPIMGVQDIPRSRFLELTGRPENQWLS